VWTPELGRALLQAAQDHQKRRAQSKFMYTPFPSVPIINSYIPPKLSTQLDEGCEVEAVRGSHRCFSQGNIYLSPFLCSPQPRPLILTPFSSHIQQHKIKLLKAKKEEDKRLPNPKRAREEDSMEEEEEKEEEEEEEGDRKVDKKRRRK